MSRKVKGEVGPVTGEAPGFKDESVEQLEEFLLQQVRAAVRSELGPLADDLSEHVGRALQDLRTDQDRRDKEASDRLKNLEARFVEQIERLRDRIGSQILERLEETQRILQESLGQDASSQQQVIERLDEDRRFLKESFALLSTAEDLHQFLENQSYCRSMLLKAAKDISGRMTKFDKAQQAELRMISEATKNLQWLAGIALLGGLAAATSAGVLVWHLLR